MSQKVMNNKTGEIFEVVSPFRSITDLKDYEDGEKYVPGTSVTSLEGYEPLESIVARCMRTVQSPNGTVYNVIDTDALKAEECQHGVFDAETAESLDEAFASADPTEAQGFDLSDVDRIQTELNEKLVQRANVKEQEKELPTSGTNESPIDKVSERIVDNSDSVSDGAEKEKENNYFPEKGK